MNKHTLALIVLSSTLLSTTSIAQQPATSKFDRTILPIAPPNPPQYTELDVRNATPPPRFEVKAPKDAPNVLLVLVDDLGFAGTSKFGGPVTTPNFDKIANEGVYYNNFHTTAVCSPTRAAIKSGRNHHVNNMGGYYRNRYSIPWKYGSNTNKCRASSRDVTSQWIQYGSFWKVA